MDKDVEDYPNIKKEEKRVVVVVEVVTGSPATPSIVKPICTSNKHSQTRKC